VAAGLAGVLLIALAVGLFANRYLRPQVGVVPTPIAIAAVPASPTTSTPVPTVASTPAAMPLALPTELRATATAPSVTTPAPAVLLATEPAAPTGPPSTVPTTRPAVSPELATEISNAYQRYWQVRADALFDLNTSRLSEVMAGEHLVAVEDRINELRAEGRSYLADIDHNYAVFEASANEAKVADSYLDNSLLVDIQTGVHLTTSTGEKFNEVYILNKSEGTWRVTIAIRNP